MSILKGVKLHVLHLAATLPPGHLLIHVENRDLRKFDHGLAGEFSSGSEENV